MPSRMPSRTPRKQWNSFSLQWRRKESQCGWECAKFPPGQEPSVPRRRSLGRTRQPTSFAESPLQHHAQRTGGHGVHALEERWRSSKGGSRQLRLPWEGWPSAGARPVRCESVIPVPSDERNSMERDQGEKASCLRPEQSPPGGESPSAHWPASKQRGNRC